MKISEINKNPKNPRKIKGEQLNKLMESIQRDPEFMKLRPIVIDENNMILGGNQRYTAIKKLGMKEIPDEWIARAENLTEEQRKRFILVDNGPEGMTGEWDFDALQAEWELPELESLGFDISEYEAPQEPTEGLADADEIPEEPEPVCKLGDLWRLGEHRLLCGDSTKEEDVKRLMDGEKADMSFNDPPYGMKKENEGVLNDNLNFESLLQFNKDWICLQFEQLKENGSFYCWGTDEPLMDIYSNIFKPYIKNQKATFRNLITWDKGHGQGQMSEEFRMYPIADEKCLFVMCGVQGFNNNADNYFEGWEPIRDYLLKSRISMGWDVPTMKKIVGHSDLSRDHWTSKSQFNFPTREVYNKMKDEADRLRHETNNDAFKKEYDELKKEYYSTRAYFNNTHENQNNVWHFERTSGKEREGTGGHATPKPIELCERAIKSSSPDSGLVLDFFLGSGSTLIACEKTSRKCYGMELSPKYCDVIIKRWENFTGKKAEKL